MVSNTFSNPTLIAHLQYKTLFYQMKPVQKPEKPCRNPIV